MRKIILLSALAMLTLTFNVISQEKSRDWTILQTYTVPGKASGLASDGTYLYYGIYGANGDRVYRFDPVSGTAELLFTNPTIGDSYGMTWDGQSLWIIDRGTTGPSYALQLSLSGAILSQFTLPNQYMSGIEYDNGNFWVGTYHPDPGWIHKVDNTGAVLFQFLPPNNQTWDICKQGDDLWIVDYNAYMIYKVDDTGVVLESHTSETQRPAGITFDGTYLWYIAGPLSANSTLYKVDLGGTGTPAIALPSNSFNYGNVTVGNSVTWDMSVQSVGTAPLVIDEIIFPHDFPVSTSATFPISIPAGQSVTIPLTYEPLTAGPLNGTIQISSNDPLNPLTNVTLTGVAVIDGPNIYLPSSNHDYGTIRTNATKRWKMMVKNNGNAMLTISSISSDNPDFYIDEAAGFPANLAPLDTLVVNVWFWPKQAVSYSGNLSIESNDPTQSPYLVTLTGAGTDEDLSIGIELWNYLITTSYDNSPKGIHYIPDINGDGKADVIVCSEDNYVRCFNGNASGTGDILWERHIYSGNIYNRQSVTLINDINNDGYKDVVVGTTGSDRSIIALSGKTGEVLWKKQTNAYGSGGWVYQVFAEYDYNGDGFPDVLACAGDDGNNQGPRRVYCLNGLTGQSIWECPLGGAMYRVIGIPDVNGDGIPDVVAAGTNASQAQGRVYGINGANGSQLWNYTTSGSSGYALAQISDINNDGKPEIVAGSFNGYIYIMDPVNGTVLAQGSAGNNIILDIQVLDDVNGDGFVDFVVANSGTAVQVFNGQNAQPLWTQILPDKPWNIARIPDITGDGKADIVLGTLFQNNKVYYFDAVDGTELFSRSFPSAVDALNVIPDVTGDNSWEVVVGGRNGEVVCLSGGTAVASLLGDANCDGVVDILDAITISNYILGNNPQPFCFDNADVTGNGIVDLLDIIGLVSIIMNGS